MSLSEMGAVYTQKTKTDCEVSLTLTEQHTGLELDEPQAPGQVQGQSDTIQFQVWIQRKYRWDEQLKIWF